MGRGSEKEIVIGPEGAGFRYWREIWDHREMLYILGWRDLRVRYKQTVLGASWSIIRPLLTTVLFTIVFNRVAGLKGEAALPYPLMVFTGNLAWQLFATIFQDSSSSLMGNMGLITKVYFPRMIIPISTLGLAMVDFLISLALLACFLIFYGVVPGLSLLALPFFILMTVVAGLGLGLCFAAMTAKYRDLRFLVPFFIQIGLFLSPVGYSSDTIPANYRLLFHLNPMTGIIEGLRWSLLGTDFTLEYLVSSSVTSAALLVAGVLVFRKAENQFADSL